VILARDGIRRADSPQFSQDRMIDHTLAAYATAIQTMNHDGFR